MQQNHLPKLLGQYLSKNGYRIDQKDLRLQLEGNPSYPSIRSVTDTLDYFKVTNVAAEVPSDVIEELPASFMATIFDKGSNILVEIRKKGKALFQIDGLSQRRRVTADQLKTIWSGTVIAVEKEEKPKQAISWLGYLPATLILLGLLALSTTQLSHWSNGSFLLLAAIGIYLSVLAIREEIGLFNKATAKICNSSSQNTNCEEVINSDYASVLGIKLSDAAISFFAAHWLTVAFLGLNTQYLVLLAIGTLSITGYSVYAQGFLQKQWCPICLGIGAVLLATSINALIIIDFATVLDAPDVLFFSQALAVYMLSYCTWILLKQPIVHSVQLQKVTLDFARFKRSDNVFQPVIKNQAFHQIIDLEKEYEVSFGNTSADLVITGITNPFCGYCTDSFKAYDRILQLYGDQVKIRLIFNVSPESANEGQIAVTLRSLELYEENPQKALMALRDWYNQPELEVWTKNYGEHTDSSSRQLLQKHFDWCHANSVYYTPMTLVGDHLFPKEYEIEDLVVLTQDIIQSQAAFQQPLTTH